MCGIIGGFTTEVHKQRFQSVIESLLLIDVIRGRDSTGIVKVTERSVMHHKKAVAAYDFLELMPHTISVISVGPLAYIGHNRAATRGAVVTRNAHPFEHGDITLVHNGTLNNTLGLDFKFTVDSEAICEAINRLPLTGVLEGLSGAYALVWHNKKDNSLNFARNDQRPLWFASVKGDDTVYWASLPEMLQLVEKHHKMEFDEIFELPVGKVWTVEMANKDMNQNWLEEDFTPRKPVEKKKYKGYDYGGNARSYVQSYNGIKVGERIPIRVDWEKTNKAKTERKPIHGHYVVGSTKYAVETWWMEPRDIRELHEACAGGKEITGIITSIRTNGNSTEFTVKEPIIAAKKKSYAVGYRGQPISKREFQGSTKGGCPECGIPLTKDNTEWWWHDYPVCKACDADVDAYNEAELKREEQQSQQVH